MQVRRTSLALLRNLRERARQGGRAASESTAAIESTSAEV